MILVNVPVSITQLAETCIVLCRGRDSNPGHPYLFTFEKGKFYPLDYLKKKNNPW